jgi:hypothetical protein
MANHRSAMGKPVDMASLIARNENTRAVGNMKVNARGDTIDAFGKVIQPVTEKVNKAYANTVGSRTANQVRQRPAHSQPIKQDVVKPKINIGELTEAERELEESFEDDLEIEKIKAQETKGKK